MKKKITYIISCLLVMVLLFASCEKIDGDGMERTVEDEKEVTTEETSHEDIATEADKTKDDEKDKDENDPHKSDDLAVHKQMLLDTQSICGVIFLGTVDSSEASLLKDRAYLKEVLDEFECEENFEFVYNISSDRIVESAYGTELYCIYPMDENASVTVNSCVLNEEAVEIETGEILYKSETGAPILLRCNANEIYFDTEVSIVDQEGNELVWQPGRSMEDGKISLPSKKPYVYDNSLYEYTYVSEEEQSYQVVNCEEWVSLREGPSNKHGRLKQVPLGALVTDYNILVDGFRYVTFEGTSGYIGDKYLMHYTYDYQPSDFVVEAEDVYPPFFYYKDMSYDEIADFGRNPQKYTYGEYTVLSSVGYTDAGEVLKVGCFRNKKPVWGYVTGVTYVGELTATMGTPVQTQKGMSHVLIFNTEMTLTAVDYFSGIIDWEIDAKDLNVGGSVCYDIDEDGTIYMSGYYDLGPTAISKDGEILWEAKVSNEDIYWPYKIQVKDNKVLVTYDSEQEKGNYVVTFDKKTGAEQKIELK